MPQSTNGIEYSLPTANTEDILNNKNKFQQTFKNWTDLDHKIFMKYLSLTNIKDHLLESRFIIKENNTYKLFNQVKEHNVLRHVTCITTDKASDLPASVTVQWAIINTLFGPTLIAVQGCSLCAILLIEKHGLVKALARLKKQWPNVLIQYSSDAILPFIPNLKNIIRGNNSHDTPIILNGTKFQIMIWKMLLKIPYGLVLSYSDLASFTKNPRSCRAVGTAVGQNPIAYLIPCHRVINSSGALGQYHWGLEKKQTMLAIERTVRKQR
jgi:AraC family transcriptional regulator of adaptative response/methylated-DNA-[protein]-cysteine methyltransferase